MDSMIYGDELAEMTSCIRENKISSFAEFVDYCADNGKTDWFFALADSENLTHIVMEYIKSLYAQRRNGGGKE